MGAFKRFKTVIALAAACIGLTAASQAAAFTTVVIDPGHGGKDGGAYWGGVAEKNLTLEVARRLQRMLEEEGIPVVLTRDSDVFIPLRERAAIANAETDAVLVSVHFNASLKRNVRGVDTFYYGSASGDLAKQIQKRLPVNLKTEDRGVKRERFTVLTRTSGPAVLVEGGFISNPTELTNCQSSDYQEKLAKSIFDGLMAWR